jgi:hypothetical protein
VHGIGGPRDPARELGGWTRALAAGMRDAGHSGLSRDLAAGRAADCVFAYYGDLFAPHQSQGAAETLPEEAEAEIFAHLLVAWVDALDVEDADEQDRRVLARARAEALPRGQAQGSPDVVRRGLNVVTTLLELKPWDGAAQWLTAKVLVRQLAQVARYLARGETNADGIALDRRIRARVAAAIGDGPAVLVSHSLGTIVALETLHERRPLTHSGIPLFVTLGSPIALRTVVWPRLVPQPPSAPEGVAGWLNFWDRDDIIAVRPHLERDVRPNRAGIAPRSRRVDSDGVWVHSADKYLAQPAVAGPIAEALTGIASGSSGDRP